MGFLDNLEAFMEYQDKIKENDLNKDKEDQE